MNNRSTVTATALLLAFLCCQVGCVANKYQLAKKNTPAVQTLAVAFPPSPALQGLLIAVISYGGPGSWKREALWDEYVLRLENHGDRPLTIDSIAVAVADGTPFAASNDPWALEKQSKVLEKQYRGRGEAFRRNAGAGAIAVGTGAAVGAAIGGASAYGITPALAGAGVAAVFVLPVYYVTVIGINHHNKKAVMAEFNRRRMLLPLTLAAGESRTGSLFYPMLRSPGSMALSWSNDAGTTTTTLPLELLRLLHVPPAATGSTAK
jgi:hypothetical protein